jgi:hypothetical protein
MKGLFTVLSLAPESPLLYWSMHILTMVCAFLLLLGVMPRLQLVLIHGCMLTFYHHNGLLWDGEDTVSKIFLMRFQQFYSLKTKLADVSRLERAVPVPAPPSSHHLRMVGQVNGRGKGFVVAHVAVSLMAD